MDKILVTRSSMPDIDEYFEEIRSMWDTHWLTNMGPKHEQFKNDLKNILEIDGIELFQNIDIIHKKIIYVKSFCLDKK